MNVLGVRRSRKFFAYFIVYLIRFQKNCCSILWLL